MATIRYPLTSAVGDTVHEIERLAWAITARLAILAIVAAVTVALAARVRQEEAYKS